MSNSFRIQKIDKWRRDTEEMLRAIGLRPSQYESLLGELSDMATQKIISSNAQFLFSFDEVGADTLAERHGCCRQTIYNKRTRALDEKSKILAKG